MPADESCLRAYWEEAAEDLGFHVRFAFELDLGAGVRMHIPVHLRGFGGPKGMLIIRDAEYGKSIKDEWLEEAVQAGYGFSVMSEPVAGEEYDRDVFIEVLRDWGWYGPESDKPAWLDRVSPPTD